MKLAQHEFVEGWCKHCGLRENPKEECYGCLTRDVPKTALAPEPQLRIPACEQTDFIANRLAELRKESETIIAGELPDEPMVLDSDCCL